MPGEIKDYLKGYNENLVDRFCKYCNKLKTEQKKGQLKNPWMQYKKPEQLADMFKLVQIDGFEIDGQHITIQSTGISYDYVAYKNKMLSKYPESIIDIQLVYKDDEFQFSKESGSVKYTHKINNPFGQDEQKDIMGGYCVIKNKRGEFLTLLSSQEIDKHRKVAKTDFIWKKWFKEMAFKTIMKKACKSHFSDIYQNIETIDNENYDIEQPLEISIETKQEIEEITDLQILKEYWQENSGKNSGIKKDFDKAISVRKAQIEEDPKNGDN